MIFISLGLTLMAAFFCYIAMFHFCHMFQLEGYKPREYIKWLSEYGANRVIYTLGMSILYVIISIIVLTAKTIGTYIIGGVLILLFFGGCVLFPTKFNIKNAKVPLKYTWRVKRIFFTGAIVLLGLSIACAFCSAPIMGIVLAGCCLFILLANAINTPIEVLVKKHYFHEAKNKLASRKDMIKIGITGSYGKTSTKFILGTILQEKYCVLVPPSSFNTPMGLTRVIREQLSDEHQVFIAEMGAKHVGDIAELVELVQPSYGIITSIGPQHLETFKSIENVVKTKYELIEGLPSNGCAFFPDDGSYAKKLYVKTACKKYLYSLNKNGDVYAEEILVSERGSSFKVAF